MYLFVVFFVIVEGTIPTDYEQATGIEKKEIDAKVAGHEVCLTYECYNYRAYLHHNTSLLP